MDDLESHIKSILSAATAESAFDAFCRIMQNHGYERIAYSLVTDHPSLGLPRQHGLATSYPEDWMKFYKEKDYHLVDPVTHRCLNSRIPFFWQDVVEEPDIGPKSLKLMNEATDSGVTAGIGISLCSTVGEKVGVGLARKTATKEKDYNFLAGAYLLSVCFHEKYRALLTKPFVVELTEKEKEVLQYAAEGKTDDVIAALMNITGNTVRFHWKNIFRKLDAFDRTYAVSKALLLHLIEPAYIKTGYQRR
jgi:DNA-binding CsgD family transcriptional regulator